MPKAAVLIDNEYQDAEAIYPYYRLQEASLDVDLVGPQANTNYQGKYGYTLTSDKSASDINVADYEAVVVPGGNAPDKMRIKESMIKIIQEAEQKGKVIAAICHAMQLLIEADIVDGKDATCYKAVKVDLQNAGGNYHNKEVVVDENLVTSRTPDDLPAFMRETLKLLE